MSFFSQFISAINYCMEAPGILFSKGFKRYMIYPLIIWLLIWAITMYGIFLVATNLAAQISAYLDPETWTDTFHWFKNAAPFIVDTIAILIKVLLHILLWMVSKTLIKYIVLIFLSPLFAMLSEKTDTKLTGREFPFSAGQLVKDIVRGILISIRNMFFEYLIMFLCFLISLFFPPLMIITVPFTFFASWYFTGFTLMDYNCERYKFNVSDSVHFMRENKGLVCGIGCVYSILLSLPFAVGSVIGMMFAPGIATIAGTMAFLKIKTLNH